MRIPAVPFQRRRTGEHWSFKLWWLPMESITGQSSLIRAFRHLALVGLASAGLAGCAHSVSNDYASYLRGNKGEFLFPQTGYEAQYYVAPQVRDNTYTAVSAMAGAANSWNIEFGAMLLDTLESDDYRGAFTTLSEIKENVPSEGLLFKYDYVNYRFINNRAEISLRIIVDRDGQQILSKVYSRNGVSQGGKMFWGGAFTMSNAIQQSTKSALDQILADSLADLQVVMNKPLEAPQTALLTSASTGAATSLSGAGSDPKQMLEANKGHYQDAASQGKAVAESLAALKVLHERGVLSDEEYMQKQRDIINEHTRKTRASLTDDAPLTTAGSSPLQEDSPGGATAAVTSKAFDVTGEQQVSESIPTITVAVFPFSRSLAGNFNIANFLLPAFAHQYISENRQLRLSASYYEDKDTKIGNKTDYWSPTSRPLESRIFSDGARIDVDVILMYSYSGKYTIDDRFDVTVYLFDVRNRLTYELSGDQNNYKRITDSLFRKVTAIQ